MKTDIVEIPLTFKGANGAAFRSREKELILSGPASSGKTFAILFKLLLLCEEIPNLRVCFVRKTRVSMNTTCLETWESEVFLYPNAITRGSRSVYQFPNGSEVHLLGMDSKDAQEKFLSSRWNFIYVNECSALREEEWELLKSRLLREGSPYNQIIGDCNPPKLGEEHWIWKRHQRGDTLLLFADHGLNPKFTEEDKSLLAGLRGDLNRRFSKGSWKRLPDAGRFFSAERFKYLDEPPKDCKWVRAWDIASGVSDTADFSACVLMGKSSIGRVVADVRRGRWSPAERNAQMKHVAELDKPLSVRGFFEKGFGAGTDMTMNIIRELEGYSMTGIKVKGDKGFRADPLSARCEAGNLWLLRAPWNGIFVDECCSFTGEDDEHPYHDDMVDGATLADKMLTQLYGR